MAQLGSEKDPIRMSARRTSKIRGRFLKNEDRKRYSDCLLYTSPSPRD